MKKWIYRLAVPSLLVFGAFLSTGRSDAADPCCSNCNTQYNACFNACGSSDPNCWESCDAGFTTCARKCPTRCPIP